MDKVQQIGLENSVVERRKHRRKLVSGAALIPVDVEPDGSFGLLVDLSEEGVAVQAVASIDSTGDKVLRWRFPGEEVATEVVGTVVWSNPNKMVGIRFGQISDETRSKIAKWVDAIDDTREQPFEESAACTAGDPAAGNVPPTEPTGSDGGTTPNAPSEKLWVDMQLSLLATQVRSELPADGVALAVASGDVFECRASAGTAPEVGAILVGDAGLSAECIRTGQVICCVDTRTDPRVDASVCEALQLRSAVVLPIKAGAKVNALLEAFWSRPQGFGESQLMALCGFAQSFGVLLDPTTSPEIIGGNEMPGALPLPDFMLHVIGQQACAPDSAAQVARKSQANPADLCVKTQPLPLGQTLSQVEVGQRRDSIGRLLVAATVILAIMAVIAGVVAWYDPLAKTTELSSSQGTSEPPPVGTTDSSFVALPEAPPAASSSTAASTATVRTERTITGVKVLSSRERILSGGAQKSRPAFVGAGGESTVLLDVSMDKEGKITAVRVVRGDPRLAKLAKDAVASNRFSISSPGGMTASPNARIVVSFGPNI